MDKLILIILGLLIIWLAINGKIGVFLASIFVPETVKVGDKVMDNAVVDAVYDKATEKLTDVMNGEFY